jgi:hypothetical protein
MPTRAVKLGGSLLNWRHAARSFHQWLSVQPVMQTLVLVGGGAQVEQLRNTPRLAPITAHWRAIECMAGNARTFAVRAELPVWNAGLVELIAALRTTGTASPSTWTVASVRQIVQQLGEWPGLAPFPCGWDVTSDSIAAQLGNALGCRELVLLKSCDVPPDLDVGQCAKAGIVDPHFPVAAGKLAVRIVNLRRHGSAAGTDPVVAAGMAKPRRARE